MDKKKNFANLGTETFSLKEDVEKAKSKVVINIEDEQDGIDLGGKLSKKKVKGEGSSLFARINRYLVERSKVKVKEKANFFHLLAVMINAGIPMIKALRSLEGQLSEKQRMRFIVGEMAKMIEAGSSLSKAMKVHKEVFIEAEVGMVQSGEASGQLVQVLNNLAKDTEKSHMIRAKVRGAMMYPIIVLVILVIVVIGMMVFVVPQLSELFEANGQNLPVITEVVIAVSDFFVEYGSLLFMLVVALIAALFFAKKTDKGKYAFDKVIIKMPIFGKLLKKSYLSRFARSLSNLLDSNVTIVDTMEITANAMSNSVYKKRLLMAREDIVQGIPLAENLSASPLFPPMLVNMIEVGEQTARLDEIMGKVAKFYEEEVDTSVAGITKIIEPIVLVIIGLTVGVFVAAIMLPIMQLTEITGL